MLLAILISKRLLADHIDVFDKCMCDFKDHPTGKFHIGYNVLQPTAIFAGCLLTTKFLGNR